MSQSGPPTGDDLTLIGLPLEIKRMIYGHLFQDSKLRISYERLCCTPSGCRNLPVSFSEIISSVSLNRAALLTALSTNKIGHTFISDAFAVLACNITLEIITELVHEHDEETDILATLPLTFTKNVKNLHCHPDVLLATDLQKVFPNLKNVIVTYNCVLDFHSANDFYCSHCGPSSDFDASNLWQTITDGMDDWNVKRAQILLLASEHAWNGEHCSGRQIMAKAAVMAYFEVDVDRMKQRVEFCFDLGTGEVMDKAFSLGGSYIDWEHCGSAWFDKWCGLGMER